MTFAEKFKAIRLEMGLTQSDVYNMHQIPIRTVQEWEAGKRIPPSYVQRLVLAELKRKEKKIKKDGAMVVRLNPLQNNFKNEVKKDEKI